MAVPAGTFETYTSVGIREDLQDLIYNVDPTETPFITQVAGQGNATNTLHEWQTDELADPDLSNAVAEGDDATIEVSAPTTRLGNRTQIMDKTAAVSGTHEATDRAGRDSEMGYQLMKRSLELRRDCESIITGSQPSSAGSSGTARTLGALENTITTNASVGATGSGGGWDGTNWTAVVDGTNRAFAEADLKTLIADTWQSSTGNMAVLMCGAGNKQKISESVGGGGSLIQRRQEAYSKTITVAVDLYQSDFGAHNVLPNRFCRTTTIFGLDPTLHTVAYLRPYRSWPLAKTGDQEKRQILVECTYVAKNEKGNFKYADVDPAL